MRIEFIGCDDCGTVGERAPSDAWKLGALDVCPACRAKRDAAQAEREARAAAEEEADAVADKARADYLAAWEAKRAAPAPEPVAPEPAAG